MTYRIFILLALSGILSACAATQLSEDAAEAKVRMVGMTREEVLECMGPAKKKAYEGATEVWSYLSTNGAGSNSSLGTPIGKSWQTDSHHERSFCNVNIVMREGVVVHVNYNGPSGGFFAPHAQCGYAVTNCVDGNRF